MTCSWSLGKTALRAPYLQSQQRLHSLQSRQWYSGGRSGVARSGISFGWGRTGIQMIQEYGGPNRQFYEEKRINEDLFGYPFSEAKLRSKVGSTKTYLQVSIQVLCTNCSDMFTSSTAQGGGGSFKNRKPIGEVGCCESGMAERIHWWTERCLRSPTLALFFSDYLPTYLSIFYVSIYRSISLSFI